MDWLPAGLFTLAFVLGIQTLSYLERRRIGQPHGRFPLALWLLGFILCWTIRGLVLAEVGATWALGKLVELRDGDGRR